MGTDKKRLPGIPDARLADIVEKSEGNLYHELEGNKVVVFLKLGNQTFKGATNSELILNVFNWVRDHEKIQN